MGEIDIYKLSNEELNYWVAIVLGLEVVGKAKCIPDYECSFLTVSVEQDRGEDHHVYVSNCVCSTINVINEKYKNQDEAYLCFNDKIHGHYTSCLSPISNYCEDWNVGGHLIEKLEISIVRLFYMSNSDNYWAASFPGFSVYNYGETNQYTVTGPTPLIAAMRSLVKYKLECPNDWEIFVERANK